MNKKFPIELVKKWENNDGVNFAVALSRITGWLLQVEWIAKTKEEKEEKEMIPIRAFVADNNNLIFDLTGIYTIESFHEKIINPIARRRNTFQGGGYSSKFYNEEKYFRLPQKHKPDEIEIEKIINYIKDNKCYLESVPERNEPRVPAYQAAKFTFGKCNPFAEAIYEEKGFEPVAIIAKRYTLLFSGSNLGYVHSFNIIDDQFGMDVWGKDSIENIVERFGIIDFELSKVEHKNVTETLKRNSPLEYEEIYKEATEIITEYF